MAEHSDQALFRQPCTDAQGRIKVRADYRTVLFSLNMRLCRQTALCPFLWRCSPCHEARRI